MPGFSGRIGPSGYRTELTSESGHHLVADEPLADGGQNLGPTPGELLAASLSACTCITLRMYADRKQWPLHSVEAVVRYEETPQHVVTRLTRTLHFGGELTEEQRQRLLKIAELCPIHKSLGASIAIDTELA
ncbi:OsmC family protein [Hymenobacter koreensis]|uniref:OsmC family protein n=1 Tax=Hymenobacter koreensis TaxID=1084523 RepID=A0ABP8ITE8_9BACT